VKLKFNLFVIFCAVLILSGSTAFASSSSQTADFGTTALSTGGGGTIDWNNQTNAQTSDNSYSTANPNNTFTKLFMASNFSFTIPSDATITGIQADVERKGSSAVGITDKYVDLFKGISLVSTEKADTITPWTTSDSTIVYGSSSDLWGTTWTYSEINNSNFTFAFACNTTGNYTCSIDHISLTIYFTEPDPPSVFFTSTVSGGTTSYVLEDLGWNVINNFMGYLVFGTSFGILLWSLTFFYKKARY
jgi:hypothetical protein